MSTSPMSSTASSPPNASDYGRLSELTTVPNRTAMAKYSSYASFFSLMMSSGS